MEFFLETESRQYVENISLHNVDILQALYIVENVSLQYVEKRKLIMGFQLYTFLKVISPSHPKYISFLLVLAFKDDCLVVPCLYTFYFWPPLSGVGPLANLIFTLLL